MPSQASIEVPSPPTKLVTFHRLIPDARLPQRADRSAAGMLPTRAYRYCEPATTASGFGYYIFPPMDFSVRFDGYDVQWRWGDTTGSSSPKAATCNIPASATSSRHWRRRNARTTRHPSSAFWN